MGSCQMPRTTLRRDVEVMDVFSCQPTRCPGAFDIHEKPERFIQVIAGYTMINDEELGLDTFTELDGDSRLIRIEQDEAAAGIAAFHPSTGNRLPWGVLLSHEASGLRELELCREVFVDV
ncbi:hypothetical protein HRG_007111 [Hirsutella rhossiliensis]|uniref:Fungal-type protein kinase domain-containing protein n=1 Tax=Hirsutella rhossiliensis TaxID=111463 RepID=A0A9P8SIH9_9HYPO|nr:uncharacterized protein HRG_07111 [Hirsutella rhossiliensis]KAH0962031.1 hypothetical protein HRG_07111 [Hirsutella rhossiliensis]